MWNLPNESISISDVGVSCGSNSCKVAHEVEYDIDAEDKGESLLGLQMSVFLEEDPYAMTCLSKPRNKNLSCLNSSM